MSRVCSLIERHRQIRLLGKRAEPFAILVEETTKVPCREFEFDQRKHRVIPSAGLDEPIDPSSFSSPAQHWKTGAGVRDDLGNEIGGERRCPPKLVRQPIETALAIGIEQPDTISREQRPYRPHR